VGITVFSEKITEIFRRPRIRGDKPVFNIKVSGLARQIRRRRSFTHRMSTKKTQHPLLALSVIPAYLGVSGAVNPYI
jgi:hypothetical protein